MKGVTTIQLFDAETGSKVFEHKEENMVTSAVSKLLSPKNEWLYGNSMNILGALSSAFPLYQRLLGGVLLFDTELSEDENNILPFGAAKNVGYAGGEYAGANRFRGSYNTNESGEVEDGYRHVWDFGTDKANGTIKSVCLTSVVGGDAGWALPSVGDTSVSSLAGVASFSNAGTIQSMKYIYGKPLFMKKIVDGQDIEYISLRNGALYSVKEPAISNLKLKTALNMGASISTVNAKLGDLKTPISQYTSPEERIYYMGGKIHHVYSTDGAQASFSITHDVYALTGELESSTVVPTATSFYGFQGPMFFYKGRYYACTTSTGMSLSVFLPDGTLESTISASDLPQINQSLGLRATSAVYIPQCDSIILVQTNSSTSSPDYMYSLNADGTLSAFHSARASSVPSVVPIPTEDNIAPYCLLTTVGQQTTDHCLLYLGFWTPYLGTINNLASSITKTTSQTMKIVYSIYNG